MFARLVQRYAETVVRRRVLIVALLLALTGGLASRIGTLKLDNDPDLWAPQDHPFIKTTHELQHLFGGRNITVIGLLPKEGDVYRPAILAKIRSIQDGIENLPEAVKSNVLSLAAKRVKAIEGNEDGMVVRGLLDTLPQTPEQAESLRRAVANNPVYINALVSPDGKAAAVIADFNLTSENSAYAPLYERIRAIAEKERDGTVDIYYGGQPVEAANFEYSMNKMPMYFGVAFLIIMGIQLLAFRSLQGMLLPMVTAILSVLWGLGLMALLGIHMDALNTTTPILIMAVATGHAVQVLKRYYEDLETLARATPEGDTREINRRAVASSLARVAPVMLTAGAVASLAFFSLTVSEMAMIRHFGIFAGLGILSILTIELSFIPALRAILPARLRTKPAARSGWLDRVLGTLAQRLASRRVALGVLTAAGVVLAVALVGAFQLQTDNSVKRYSRPDSRVRQDGRVLNDKFGGTDAVFFLVDAGETDGLKNPAVLQGMEKLQTFLDGQPYVGKTQSIVDLIKRMNRAMHRDEARYDTVPDRRDLVAQYLLLYSLSGDPQDFDNLVDNDYRKAVVWALLKTDSTAYAESLYQKSEAVIAQSFPAGVSVRTGGGLAQTVAINRALTETKVKNMVQMGLVVFLLASLALGSFVGGVLVIVPLGAIVLANLGIMGWLGIPLDMGTATTTALVTGIGADYEIYMLYRLREEYLRHRDMGKAMRASLLSSGKAVLFVALSIAGGYVSMIVSDFGFYSRLSITMMTTMLISALLSLIFLRAVITVFKPRFLTGETEKPRAVSRPALALEKH
jgi:uncharacterized protein